MKSYEIIEAPGGKIVKAWTRGVTLEPQAQEQLKQVAQLKFVHPYPAVMPDGHLGIGCTVGAVVPTYKAIIPAVVGVDIGCGMNAVETNLVASQLPDNLSGIRAIIERVVPAGKPSRGARDTGSWHDVPEISKRAWAELALAYKHITNKHPQVKHQAPDTQLGTLGTGNHFVEICLDERQVVWIVLHSGSRGAGNRIGTYFIEKAKEQMALYGIDLPNQDLAFFPEETEGFEDYTGAVMWAQQYAKVNREVMMTNILFGITQGIHPCGGFAAKDGDEVFPAIKIVNETISCHHNYVELEHHFGKDVWVARKGAVRARLGELGIIPGSMGTRSYIVRGLGNPESFNSCSHGAGRAMSRTEAKRRFTLKDHALATQGVECRKDADVLDETPGAYKDIDAVMAAQKDLVETVHTLKQVLCVKG